jgi:probable HAF family extracellular repeat protein
MTSRRRLTTLILAALAVWSPAAASSAAEPYMILGLGTLGGGGSAGFALNNRGQAVGGSTTAAGATHSFLWEGVQMTDLGTLGGSDSVAFGINSRGQIVGASYTESNAARHAFLWEGGKMTDLGTLGGSISIAYAINRRGQVVGETSLAEGAANHAFLWEDGKMIDLGTLGGDASAAYGINDLGQVVGASWTARNAALRAFLWEKGRNGMQDLGTLGGLQSVAYSINNRGQVAGEAQTAGDAASRAFVWENGKKIDLGTLGGLDSSATGINNLGQVVGYAATALQNRHAFVWDPDQGMNDLNSQITPGSGWELVDAPGLVINDAGEILGDGNFKLQRLAYLLIPPTGRALSGEAVSQAQKSIDRLRQDVQRVIAASPESGFLYLIDTLSAAEARLVDGKTTTAMNLLQAFIHQVDALIQDRAGGPLLARSDGQPWMDTARAILDQLKVVP